ncbi:MAG: NYN domain-containing protein [Acholeplasmatales bacterium]|nr:NYN domain-containing protein [Acholeplasmatales bacterium]
MKYALLIDSENAKPALDEIFQEISKYGDTPIRLLIGDFTTFQTKPWISLCQKHAISCVQTMNFTNGKNSLDISLVIEGMKILYEKPYIDGIIIVASDSDYTPLCREWRSMGKEVIGIGKSNSPESYRASCTKFIYIENLFTKTSEKKSSSLPLEKVKKFTLQVLDANNGRCQMSLVCESLIKTYPDFDVRSYGYNKSIDFFKNEFKELDISEGIKNTYFLAVRDSNVKPTKPQPKVEAKNEPKKKKAKASTKKKAKKENEYFGNEFVEVFREELDDDDDLPF